MISPEAMHSAENSRDRLWAQVAHRPGVEGIDIGLDHEVLVLRVHVQRTLELPEAFEGIPVRQIVARYKLES